MRRKLLGNISVGFDAADQLLIAYSAFVRYLSKNTRISAAALYKIQETLRLS